MAVLDSINAIRQWLDRLEQEVQQLEAQSYKSESPTAPTPQLSEDEPLRIAWGAKVSPTFKERVQWVADNLGCDVNHLMACMAWESGETFSASVRNAVGSGATGLIQFMPSTAKALGTTTAKLAAMTPEDQLRYVYYYFKPYAGRLHNLGDVYMAILWPKGVGQPDHYVLFDKRKTPTTFRQNSGLDLNKDGLVTRAECLVKINEKLAKGLQEGRVG